MKKLVMLWFILLGTPSLVSALELSAAQENYCVQMGSLAVVVGEGRDTQAPRNDALSVMEQARGLSPALRTWAAGLVFWVYDRQDLRPADLYVPIVVACREELTRQAVAQLQDEIRVDMARHCAIMTDIGTAIAGKTGTLSQAQSLARWKDVDPQYAARAAYYEKLVPFVYQRKRMAPAALRVAVTQQCLDNVAGELEAQVIGWVRR